MPYPLTCNFIIKSIVKARQCHFLNYWDFFVHKKFSFQRFENILITFFFFHLHLFFSLFLPFSMKQNVIKTNEVFDFGSINHCWGLDYETYFTFSFPHRFHLSRTIPIFSSWSDSQFFFSFALEKLISKRKNSYNRDIFFFPRHWWNKKEGEKFWHGFTFLYANILWKILFLLIRFNTNVFLSRGLLLCKQQRQNVSITVDERAPKPYAYKKRGEIE